MVYLGCNWVFPDQHYELVGPPQQLLSLGAHRSRPTFSRPLRLNLPLSTKETSDQESPESTFQVSRQNMTKALTACRSRTYLPTWHTHTHPYMPDSSHTRTHTHIYIHIHLSIAKQYSTCRYQIFLCFKTFQQPWTHPQALMAGDGSMLPKVPLLGSCGMGMSDPKAGASAVANKCWLMSTWDGRRRKGTWEASEKCLANVGNYMFQLRTMVDKYD